MKITRRELDGLIEDYLLETQEDLLNERIGGLKLGYELPECNFKPSGTFLNIFSLVFKHKLRPPRGGVRDDSAGKPDVLNPVFLSMFQNTFLPYVNYLVAPQFGISAMCRVLQRLNDLFDRLYLEFEKGLAPTITTSPGNGSSPGPEAAVDILENYDIFFLGLTNKLKQQNIKPTQKQIASEIVNNPPPGLTTDELVFASILLGNLNDVQTINRSITKDIVRGYDNLSRASSIKDSDLLTVASYGRSRDDYDELSVKELFRFALNQFDNKNQAPTILLAYIDNLITKLETARII